MIRNADQTVENSDPGILKNPAPKMGKLSSKIVKTQLKIRKPSSKSGKTQFLRLLLSVRNRVRCTKDKPDFTHQPHLHTLYPCNWWSADDGSKDILRCRRNWPLFVDRFISPENLHKCDVQSVFLKTGIWSYLGNCPILGGLGLFLFSSSSSLCPEGDALPRDGLWLAPFLTSLLLRWLP